MSAAPRRAAIYARISQDAEGLSAGVERQLRECRDLATRKGWTIAQEYVDNDISASHSPAEGYRFRAHPASGRVIEDRCDEDTEDSASREGLVKSRPTTFLAVTADP